MKYDVVIVVDDIEKTEFQDWLQKNKAEILGISENSGCQCCIDIFTIELADTTEKLLAFTRVEGDHHPKLYEGLEKDRIINEYLA